VPREEAVMPFPIEDTTPPVTKTYFGTGTLLYPERPPTSRGDTREASRYSTAAPATAAPAAAPRGSRITNLVSSEDGDRLSCSLG